MKNKDIQIIPTVMPEDYDDLVDKIDFVRHAVNFVNIDIMDGKFVPSVSWPYSDKSHFDRLMHQEEGLPYWQEIDFSVDLMVSNPKEEVMKWIEVGVSEVVIHVESLVTSCHSELDTEHQLTDSISVKDGRDDNGLGWLKQLKEDGLVKICLALSPNTSNEELEKYTGLYDSVQFMGIEKIGYQGQEFVDKVLKKISDFKEKYPDIPIMVDGSVNEETISDLAKSGATRFAVGSYIFESDNAKEAIRSLEEMVKNN